MDSARFKRLAYDLAGRRGYSVRLVQAPGPSGDFWAAELSDAGDRVYLLCTPDDEMAFCAPWEDGPIRFLDRPHLGEGYSILSKAELDGPRGQALFPRPD